MLVTKEVEVKITKQNIEWYQSKGYDCDLRDIIIINPNDLTPKNSRVIMLKCDYCGRDFQRRFADHTFIKSKNGIDKDACKNCNNLKFKEQYLLDNGVENPFQLASVKDKIKVSNINKYGVENPMHSEEIKEKLRNSNILKYGVDNPSKSEEVKQRIVDTMNERYGVDNIMELAEYRLKIANSLSKNNSVSTSKQQKHLHNLLGGNLNYADNCPVLDIAFPEERIYLEYNGGGHDLKVKLGMLTKEEFRQKELRRYHYLKDNGWSAMFVDSDNDLLPNNDTLNEMFIIGMEYLTNGGKWIKFDIGAKVVIYDGVKDSFNYGRLRKIKDKEVI